MDDQNEVLDSLGLGSAKKQALTDAFDNAFARLGAEELLVKIGEANPVAFVGLMLRAQPLRVETKQETVVRVEWAGPERLSYRNNHVVEVPATPSVPALPQPETAMVIPLHPSPSRKDSSPGE